MAKSGTALITGAAGGLGQAFATALAARGYNLLLSDKSEGSLNELAGKIAHTHSISAQALVADLTVRDDVRRVAQKIVECGDLAFLVNNAGFGIPGKFINADPEKWIAMIDVHVAASCWFCRAALPGMVERRRGAIINLASLAALRAKSTRKTERIFLGNRKSPTSKRSLHIA